MAMSDEEKQAALDAAEAASRDQVEAKNKERFFGWLNEWADERDANRAKSKTNRPQSDSFLGALFGGNG